jgi:hypothetical protein
MCFPCDWPPGDGGSAPTRDWRSPGRPRPSAEITETSGRGCARTGRESAPHALPSVARNAPAPPSGWRGRRSRVAGGRGLRAIAAWQHQSRKTPAHGVFFDTCILPLDPDDDWYLADLDDRPPNSVQLGDDLIDRRRIRMQYHAIHVSMWGVDRDGFIDLKAGVFRAEDAQRPIQIHAHDLNRWLARPPKGPAPGKFLHRETLLCLEKPSSTSSSQVSGHPRV